MNPEHIADEELKNAKRIRAKRKKRKRAIATVFLTVILIASLGAATYMGLCYKNALTEADKAKQEAEDLKAELDSVKSELENNAKEEDTSVTAGVSEKPDSVSDSEDYVSMEDAELMAKQASEEAVDDYLTLIRQYTEQGEYLTMLEEIFPNNIVVPDTGHFVYFDINDDLKKTEVDHSLLTYPVKDEDSGKYHGEAAYTKDGVSAKKGVDVSKFQGDVDWNSVKSDGVEYAFIRLGYRGYESGKIVTDDKYEDNITACNDLGLDCGVYFFTEAMNEAEGIEEAEYVLENLEGHHVELPIVIDVEQSANVNKSRTKNLTSADRTKAVIGFCERIKQAGYEPMIYGNLKSMLIMLDFEQLEEYEKWFAYYHYPLRFPYRHRIWQYTASGKVNGISGDADLNLMFY